MIISVFTPHGGCPERCRFCDQKTSGGAPVSASHVTETIRAHLFGRDVTLTASEIAFYGGTFTAMPRERQKAYLEAVKPYLFDGSIESVRIATRPDAVDEQWIRELRDTYRLRTVELGLQSFDENVLKSLGRSHSNESVVSAVETLKRLELRVGIHLMLGCPGESDREDELTLEWVSKLRPDTVRIHPLLVIRGTSLESAWRQGEFKALDLDTAVSRAAWLTRQIENLGVRVIRLGLQPNELLGLNVVAGAYHPAFGDLVRSRIDRDRIAERLEPSRPILCGRAVEVKASPSVVNSLKARGSENLEWLKTRFKLSSLIVSETTSTSRSFELIL